MPTGNWYPCTWVGCLAPWEWTFALIQNKYKVLQVACIKLSENAVPACCWWCCCFSKCETTHELIVRFLWVHSVGFDPKSAAKMEESNAICMGQLRTVKNTAICAIVHGLRLLCTAKRIFQHLHISFFKIKQDFLCQPGRYYKHLDVVLW